MRTLVPVALTNEEEEAHICQNCPIARENLAELTEAQFSRKIDAFLKLEIFLLITYLKIIIKIISV